MGATTRAASGNEVDAAVARLAEATATTGGNLPKLDAGQLDKLKRYLETLLLWRSRMALISTADPLLLVEHHIVDSLHLVAHVSERATVADIGSGAGLPGIPLAVALPDVAVKLVESRRKKANFLREARRLADLRNIEVVEGRAEECLPAHCLEAVVSRALGSVEEFLELGSRVLAAGGVAIAMRGPDGTEDAISDSRFEVPKVVGYELAGGRRRTLLEYRLR